MKHTSPLYTQSAPGSFFPSLSKKPKEDQPIFQPVSLRPIKPTVPGGYNSTPSRYTIKQVRAPCHTSKPVIALDVKPPCTPLETHFKYFRCSVGEPKFEDIHSYKQWDELHQDDDFISNEYSDEIMEYLMELETRRIPSKNMICTLQQGYNDGKTRSKILNGMYYYRGDGFVSQTAFLSAVNLFERYLSIESIPRKWLMPFAAACLFITVKSEDCLGHQTKEIIHSTVFGRCDADTNEKFIQMEHQVLEALDYEVTSVSPLDHLKRMIGASPGRPKISICGRYLIDLMAFSSKFMETRPSMCAAVAIYVARAMFIADTQYLWDDDMIKLSGGYTKDDLEPSLRNLLLVIPKCAKGSYLFKDYNTNELFEMSSKVRKWAKDLEKEGVDIMWY